MKNFEPTLTGNAYQIYDKARKSKSWELDFDWQDTGLENLSDFMKHIAWHLASQQTFIEQVGQISAAQLLVNAPTPELRFALSRSVSDEARHAEIFARFALSCRRKLDAPDSTMLDVQSELNTALNFDYHFLTHVILENYALEQFSIYRELFAKCLLGKLYAKAITDESRHVAVGLHYFQSKSQTQKNRLFRQENEIMRGPAKIPDEVIRAMAKIAEASEGDFQNRFRNRHKNFISRIFH